MDLKKPFKTPSRGPAAVEPAPQVEVQERDTSPAVPEEDDPVPEDDPDSDVQIVDAKSSRPCACSGFSLTSVLDLLRHSFTDRAT